MQLGFVRVLPAALLVALAPGPPAHALTIFSESFDGYTSFPDERPDDEDVNLGLPLVSEGADETWLSAQFGEPEEPCSELDLQADCKLAIQESGGDHNGTPVGRFEDRAALVFAVDTTGLQDVILSYVWRTFAAASGDELVAGFFVGTSFPADWSQWQELNRQERDTDFSDHEHALPSNAGNVFVAFWLDGGNNDYGKLDDVLVTAVAVPEPSTIALVLVALVGLAARRRRF